MESRCLGFFRVCCSGRVVFVAKVADSVRPVPGVSGAHQENGGVLEVSVLSIPVGQVIGGQDRVRVLLTSVLYVHQGGWNRVREAGVMSIVLTVKMGTEIPRSPKA